MLRIYACLANEHDIRFVAFAVGICLLSSLTALGLAKHVQQLEAARRLRWLLLTGYVTGVVYDVATAGRAVRAANERHDLRVSVMPTAVRTSTGLTPGLAAVGSF